MECSLHNIAYPDIPEWVRISDQRRPPKTDNVARAVWQVKDGERVKRWECIADAKNAFNKTSNNIYDALKHEWQCWGFYWEYAD
jgi:hypothetical protein